LTLKCGKNRQEGMFCSLIFFSFLFVNRGWGKYNLRIFNEYRYFFVVSGKELLGERNKKLGHELDKRKNLSHLSYPKPMLYLTYQCR